MNPPKVSIGLPVYNGEKYLRSALDSLLAQEYPDFELIISDNASTDGTAGICAEYAAQWPRISYGRNSHNIGMVANFNKVFELSTGKYFMWAAHDDLWSPRYLPNCVQALEQHPDAVLCSSEIVFVDDNHAPAEHVSEFNLLHTQSMGPRERVRALTEKMGWYTTYGVIRSDVLRDITPLMTRQYGADVVFLMRLLFRGETLVIPEPLFYYHLPDQNFNIRYYQQLLGISARAAQFRRPYTELVMNLVQAVDESGFSEELARDFKADLLNNVSRNRQWLRLILSENFGGERLSAEHVAAAIGALSDPEASLRRLREVQDAVFAPVISNMPRLKRARVRLRRSLDKHVFHRFRPWP